ncbi:hypothetical protein [Agitococcus lubricus]|uniref:Uncharacterized protein n=1 Tax=Agitococcus lubricus TaxID=1077255 RepID=A0A2T5IW79_9GAMM|nr:hypothetical protein [Agitococcus lubricus]PTQ88143.1 hypothetical protein C8N29_1141 [Agitococcus lubricus]
MVYQKKETWIKQGIDLSVSFSPYLDIRLDTYITDWLPYNISKYGGVNEDYEANAYRLESALTEFVEKTRFSVDTEPVMYLRYDGFRLYNQTVEETGEIFLFNEQGSIIGFYNAISNKISY